MTIQEIHDSIRALESEKQILKSMISKNIHDGNTKDNEIHKKRIADNETAITALENYKEQSYIAMQMNNITTEMAEYVCDHICKYPCGMKQDELEKQCDSCLIDKFIIKICNLGEENTDESEKCEKK